MAGKRMQTTRKKNGKYERQKIKTARNRIRRKELHEARHPNDKGVVNKSSDICKLCGKSWRELSQSKTLLHFDENGNRAAHSVKSLTYVK